MDIGKKDIGNTLDFTIVLTNANIVESESAQLDLETTSAASDASKNAKENSGRESSGVSLISKLADKLKSKTSKKSNHSVAEGTSKEKKYKRWLHAESILLGVVIFIVWGLFSLPIVFYHLPVEMEEPSDDDLFNDTEQPIENQTCNCLDEFYCEAGSSLCTPMCGSWEEYPHSTVIITDVVVILSAITATIGAVAVLIISGFRAKKVLVFPSVFVFYQTIDVLAVAICVLITYTDRTGLYCSSQSLIETTSTATPFCIISGVIFNYAVFQLLTWWLFHIIALFWKIRFPFHARRMESARKIRYIHTTAVVVGLLLPLLSVIVPIAKDATENTHRPYSGKLGFGITRFPPFLCTGIDRDSTFYSLALPLNIILVIGVSMLLSVFWIVHKQQGLFKSRQSQHTVNLFKIGTAERKLLIVFCYYVLLGVLALVSFTLFARNSEQFTSRLSEYFMCEESHDESMPCSRDGFESLSNPAGASIAFVLMGIIPIFGLMFVISIQEIKEKCVSYCYSRAPTSDTGSSSALKRDH